MNETYTSTVIAPVLRIGGRSEASWQSRDISDFHEIATAFGLAMTMNVIILYS